MYQRSKHLSSKGFSPSQTKVADRCLAVPFSDYSSAQKIIGPELIVLSDHVDVFVFATFLSCIVQNLNVSSLSSSSTSKKPTHER